MPSCFKYFFVVFAFITLIVIVARKTKPFQKMSPHSPEKDLIKHISLMLMVNSQLLLLSATAFSFAFLPENANNDFYLFKQEVKDPLVMWCLLTFLGVLLYTLGVHWYKKASAFYIPGISFSWWTSSLLVLIPVFSSILSIFSIVDSLISAN